MLPATATERRHSAIAVVPVPRAQTRNWRLGVYVSVTTAIGLSLYGWLAAGRLGQGPPHELSTVVVVSVLLIAGELIQIPVQRRGQVEGVNLSGVFACALLLRWDLAIAVLIQGLASFLQGAVDRITWWKRLFNVAQYTLSLGAAAFVFHRFAAGLPPGALSANELFGALSAACVFFATNHTLMGVAFSLIDRSPIVESLVVDVGFQASINGVAAALAPMVIVALDASPWLLVLLLLPLAAVHRSASLAITNDHQARHDALTGLPNGSSFRHGLDVAISEAGRHDRGVAVVMIDIDDFTEVNDTLGHRMGDTVLRQMAERLTATVGNAGVVARFGGDEFSLLVPDLASPLEATQLVDTLVHDMETPFTVEGSALNLKASLGMSFFPQHGDGVEVLVQRADVALNLAKRHRTAIEIYSPDRDQYNRRRLVMFAELPQAIAKRDLTVHYQPKADLRTGRLVGAEALLRWAHPELGLVPPDEFIGVAEHTGQIRQISDYVLNETARQISAWRAAGIEFPVSVNLSALDLRDERLPEKAARLLAVWGIPGRSLVVEVTETALMSDPERAFQVLTGLQELHIRISMDDFGTGYSSLAQLKRLPVDEIKIDRSFIMNLESDDGDQVIVRSTIELAHNLGLDVVAEGVATDGEWRLLNQWGCDKAQGFLISRPVPADELTARLRALQRPQDNGRVLRADDTARLLVGHGEPRQVAGRIAEGDDSGVAAEYAG